MRSDRETDEIEITFKKREQSNQELFIIISSMKTDRAQLQ